MLSILMGGFIIVLTGIFDDIKPVWAVAKFILHVVAACIVVFYGNIVLNDLTVFGLYISFPVPINYLITIFFIVGITNAINLIDGLDGLSSGVSAIYFATIAVIAFILNRMQGLDTILSLIMIMSFLNIIEIIYLAIDSYLSKTNEKTDIDIANTAVFMGLCLLIIGSTLCFLKKISILKFSAIFLILITLGVYILYDMNCIFLDSRREFKNTEYVRATIFIYVDVLSTLLELSEKLFNSCEPERKPSRKQSVRKSMIYTGDEDYKKYYKKDSDEKDKKGNEDNNNNKTHQRRLSSMDLKRNMKLMMGENPIFEDDNEDDDQEIEVKDEESKEKEKEDFSEDKGDKEDEEGNLSFKKQNDHILKMDDDEEEDNNNNNGN